VNRYNDVAARTMSARGTAISLCGVFCLAASAAPVPSGTPSHFDSGGVGPLVRAYSNRAWHSPTGATVDGVALSLTLNSYSLHFNNMLVATVELRNVSDEPKTSPLAASGTTYTVTVVNRDTGEKRSFDYRSELGAPNGYQMAPETSVYLTIDPELSWAWFSRIGSYALAVRIKTANASTSVQSETVSVTVLPKAANALGVGINAGDESSSAPGGLPQRGLALSLTGESPVRIGNPIYVRLEVRNVSDEQVAINWPPVVFDNFSVVDRDTGEAVARIPGPPDLYRAATPFFAGALWLLPRRSLYTRIQLDELYQIKKPGTYSIQLSTDRISVTNAHGWHDITTLRSNMIAVNVSPPHVSAEPESKAGVYEDSSADTPAGPASHGFALSLESGVSSALLGAPLTATVELRNVSGRPQYAFFGSRGDYRFTIVSHEAGQVARNLHIASDRNPGSARWSSMPIFPGASLCESFRLDSFVIFGRIGTYIVHVQGRPVINGVPVELQSSPLTISIR
jgi:hypothetical protein